MAKLSHAERSEISRKVWRKRKREGGKAKCAFCGKTIFARGVRMNGKPYHKGCAEAKGAGLKPAQVGRNPSKSYHINRVWQCSKKLSEAKRVSERNIWLGKLNEAIQSARESGATDKEIVQAQDVGNPTQVGKNPYKYKWESMWGKTGILLYKKDMSDKNSVGIGREHLSAVIRYLERGTGFLGLANRLDLTKTSVGITMKDYQGRRLYIPNNEIPKALDALYSAMLTSSRNPKTISERKRAPRDAFRYFGAEELNPSRRWHRERVSQLEKAMPYSKRGEYGRGQYDEAAYAEKPGLPNPKFKFGPTGFRPPAKWFAKMAQGTSASHFGRKLKELTASQRAKVGQIVGGIWAKYTDATRMQILRKYEPSAVRALANPSMLGKRAQMLNCPACGGLNPVSRLNVYLRCNTCGAPLRSVRVRHKR